jgi:thioredoxin-like negative regulator of GroEL
MSAVAWLPCAVALTASLTAAGDSHDASFEASLAAAAKMQKPLVVQFGSEGCAPCKRLTAALKTRVGAPELARVHLVEIRADTEVGHNLTKRFHVRGTPTLVAFGPAANELDRWVDFDGDVEAVIDWLREVPHHVFTLERTIAEADGTPSDLPLQLIAGRRLIAAGKGREARPYLARATHSPRQDIAAAAIWATALLGTPGAERRQAAEQILKMYPLSRPAMAALDVVVEEHDPPSSLIAEAIRARVPLHRNRLRELDRLTWLALRAGLPDVAGETVNVFRATLPPDVQAVYDIEIQNARGEFRDARESLVALKARQNSMSRLYPVVLSELATRIQTSRRQPPAKPLFVRFDEIAEQSRPPAAP